MISGLTVHKNSTDFQAPGFFPCSKGFWADYASVSSIKCLYSEVRYLEAQLGFIYKPCFLRCALCCGRAHRCGTPHGVALRAVLSFELQKLRQLPVELLDLRLSRGGRSGIPRSAQVRCFGLGLL